MAFPDQVVTPGRTNPGRRSRALDAPRGISVGVVLGLVVWAGVITVAFASTPKRR